MGRGKEQDMCEDSQASIAEQEICVTCGFCCDATLFEWATVEDGEKPDLPEKLKQKCYSSEDGEAFKQPCPYFKDKCTIYDQKKALVCSSYQCQLLQDLSAGKIGHSEAKNVVKNAMALRDEMFQLYEEYDNSEIELSFTEILLELKKKKDAKIKNGNTDKHLELLVFKANILEILLLKHFKSSEDFEKSIMGKKCK